MPQLSYHRILLTLPILLVLATTFSCASKESNNTTNQAVLLSQLVNRNALNGKVDISISIKQLKQEVIDYLTYGNDEYLTYRIIDTANHTIIIDATSAYYNNYMSKKRFFIPDKDEAFFRFRGHLNLNVYIVNNTKEPLDIEELDLQVVKSTLDSLPYVYIFTDKERSNSISFINESWNNWKGFTFYYTILKSEEVFSGSYTDSLYIPFFKTDTTIHLLPKLMQMGYDFERICRTLELDYPKEFDQEAFLKICDTNYHYQHYYDTGDTDYDTYEDYENKYECICSYIYGDKYYDYYQLFYPFELPSEGIEIGEDGDTMYTPCEAYAPLFGKIVFDLYENPIEFIAHISLNHACGGAGYDECDSFDVLFKTTGNNYILRYPYTTVIEPRGMELISLSIKAEKSSNHLFYVSLRNSDSKMLRTDDIRLHYMAPPHYIISNE